jgi:hypothetical protein
MLGIGDQEELQCTFQILVEQLAVGYTPEFPLVILLARKLLFEYQQS